MNSLENQSPTYRTAYLMQYYGILPPDAPINEDLSAQCSLSHKVIDNYLQNALNSQKEQNNDKQ